MKNFYHRLPPKDRPRVLGLTASPLVNVKRDVDDVKLNAMLTELETRLDARVACLSRLGVADSNGELLSKEGGDADEEDEWDGMNKNLDDRTSDEIGMGIVQKNAEERSVHFSSEAQVNMPILPPHVGIGLHESRIKEFNQLNELYLDLGPKLTSIYSTSLAREVSRNRYVCLFINLFV